MGIGTAASIIIGMNKNKGVSDALAWNAGASRYGHNRLIDVTL